MKVSIQKNHGHPWNNSPGFDLLTVYIDSNEIMDDILSTAERRGWLCWIHDNVSEFINSSVTPVPDRR